MKHDISFTTGYPTVKVKGQICAKSAIIVVNHMYLAVPWGPGVSDHGV